MGLFNFFGKTNEVKQEQKKTKLSEPSEAIDSKGLMVKETLIKSLNEKLSAQKFSPKEIQEVIEIINKAELEIQKLKESIIEIKPTQENAKMAIIKIRKEVTFIQSEMAANIKTKIRQIKLRKQERKKERL